jgi:hypothetical protein
MRLFLVRRTRSFIIKNYAEFDRTRWKRPISPSPLESACISHPQASIPSSSVPTRRRLRSLCPAFPGRSCRRHRQLALPRYGRSLYRKDQLPADLSCPEKKMLDDLSRAGKRMKGFCRTNLFKRLESSAHAFLLSIHRHILRNDQSRSTRSKTSSCCPSASRMPPCSTPACGTSG